MIFYTLRFVRFLHEKDAECASQYFNNYLLEDGRTLIVSAIIIIIIIIIHIIIIL